MASNAMRPLQRDKLARQTRRKDPPKCQPTLNSTRSEGEEIRKPTYRPTTSSPNNPGTLDSSGGHASRFRSEKRLGGARRRGLSGECTPAAGVTDQCARDLEDAFAGVARLPTSGHWGPARGSSPNKEEAC